MAKELNKKKSKRNIKLGFKIRKKFANAFKGLTLSLKEESTLVYYLIITIIVVGVGVWCGISRLEWAILLITFGVLYGIEFINTAIENFVDLLSFEYNFQAKKIKDICAAASVLNALLSLGIGFCILCQPLIDKINTLIR